MAGPRYADRHRPLAASSVSWLVPTVCSRRQAIGVGLISTRLRATAASAQRRTGAARGPARTSLATRSTLCVLCNLCVRAEDRYANASIGGQEQIRFRSPYGLSIRPTLGQNLRARTNGSGKAAC